MSLAAGQSLSFYEILGPLGAGAMGEVYRARDPRLDREVAIKVLPEHFADDEERLLRFEREAKALASLNHPNVAAIHGVDQVGEIWFLVLELVPGETLDERLARGPMPLEETIDVCRQVAEGLEAAHETGVIHRDLKPANVRITPDGKVKVLDFGLAKPARGGKSGSSTDSVLTTEAGRLLGTPTYMAPEQARGKPIDRRVDIWALGCVLYECLAGERAFDGGSIADVIGAVLERTPDWTALPARTPTRIRELTQRCLSKDPHKRIRDAGDARLELERALEQRAWTGASAGSDKRGSRGLSWTHAVAIGAGLAIGAALWSGTLWDATESTRVLRLTIDMELSHQETFPRIAPDGDVVVHEGLLPAAQGEQRVRALFRRGLNDFESQPLPGTENPTTFCFSPDGEYLAVLVERSGRGGELTALRVHLRGDEPTVRLGVWPRRHRSASGIAWPSSDRLVSGADPHQLVVFSIESGTAELLPVIRAFERPGSGIDVYRSLGDGKHVLCKTYYYEERGYLAAVVAVDLETGVEKIIVKDGEFGAIRPDGGFLFARGETLFEAPFDLELVSLTGPATPLATGLRTTNAWRAAWFDVARNGTLIWLPGGRQGKRLFLSTFDRSGETTVFWPQRMRHDSTLCASPDGTFVTSLMVSRGGERVELWGSEVARSQLRRLLGEPGIDFVNGLPLPGGREMIYQRVSESSVGDGIYRVTFDSMEEPTLLIPAVPDGPDLAPVAIAPSGEFLVLSVPVDEGVQYSTIPLPLAEVAQIEPLIRSAGDQFWPKFSDDGRWIAYVTDDADRSELIVQEMVGRAVDGRRIRIQTHDGQIPWDFVWSRNPNTGRLDFLAIADDRRTIYAVPFDADETGDAGGPQIVGRLDDAYVSDLAPLTGGRAMLLLQDPEEQETDRIAVVIGILAGSSD